MCQWRTAADLVRGRFIALVKGGAARLILRLFFAGPNLASIDPAKEPRNTGATPQRWTKVNSVQYGDLATGLWEATWLSKRTFEASNFSQPCGQIS